MGAFRFGTLRPTAASADVEVNLPTLGAAIDAAIGAARAGAGCTLFTLNLDHLMKLKIDRRFREAYGRADFVTADGWPIVWMLRRRGGAFERATGADLLEPLCARAAELKLPVYFIGPSRASLAAGLDVLAHRYPKLTIAGANSPRIDLAEIDEAAALYASELARSGARICVISLGAPKQELLADALRRRCPGVCLICVGAALDFISGAATRAPQIVQALKLEWFWRLASDPRRLAGRYLGCLALFASVALRSAIDETASFGVRGAATQA